MRNVFTVLIVLLMTFTSFSQSLNRAIKMMGPNSIIFIDSVEAELNILQSLNPQDISNIEILKPKTAKKFIGDKGKNGAIYITTIKAAKHSYWSFLTTKSDQYGQIVKSPEADTIVQYIVNGEALSDGAVISTLFLITDKTLKSLTVIDKEKLAVDNVYPKRYIVSIIAKRPKGLVKRK